VGLDRAATLRNAEKLLRQGKLDAAIAEYLRVVEDQPRDWNTANMLGDLYLRAGQTDKAVGQFMRIAESLNEQGFLPKASALYKKILKLKPDHEHALMQAAEIAASQGLYVDARTYLNGLADRRRARGDARGAAQIAVRLGSLDPADFDARIAGAAARVDIGDTAGAVSEFKAVAAELAEKGRHAEAIEALRRAATLDDADEAIRAQLLDLYVAAGDFGRAIACAATADQFRALAGIFESAGHSDNALDALREAARLDPDDTALRAHLARAFVARGDVQSAAEYLNAETVGDDPQLLLTTAEIQLRAGKTDEGIALLQRLIVDHPGRRDDIALVGWNIADQAPDSAFKVVELAADAAVAQSDWPAAAAALQEFVTRVPNHIPALMRLVEICVDGGLEATMYSAQAHLADAYITAGSAAEARFIAEDLVAREPWERANIERFRRALVLLGEPDPDALIAERLSGQSPFTSTDLLGREEFPALDVPPPAESAPESAPASGAASASLSAGSVSVAPPPPAPATVAPPASAPVPAAATPVAERKDATHFRLSANAIDLDSFLGDLESSAPQAPLKPPTAHAKQQSVEVDLSIVLQDIKPKSSPDLPATPAATQTTAPVQPVVQSNDIEGVFAQLRDEAARRTTFDAAEEQLALALKLRHEGKIDECMEALAIASRSPRHRFQAAALIGRLYRERNMMPQAIDWFERAAQAPAPTPDEGHVLLYELADALESIGEVSRALAICLELQAEAGDYRDLPARVDRLAKVQTGG